MFDEFELGVTMLGGIRVFAISALIAMLSVGAQAAIIGVSNSDFEDPYTLTHTHAGNGDWARGAAGWATSSSGSAGTFAPIFSNVYFDTPDAVGDRVGFVNAGSSLYQLLDVTIQPDTDYSLTALFGHRKGHGFGGAFGFFAGDPSNIIATTAINDPGTGFWGAQTFTLDASFLNAFLGQQLGIIFLGFTTQINLDRVLVEYFADDANTLINPLPGAAWLFGSALVAGVFAGRKRRKNVAAAS